MSDNSNNSTRTGIGFTGLLALLFIALKLLNVIDWSWWWVLAPLWGGIAFALVVLLTEFVVIIIKDKRDKRKK